MGENFHQKSIISFATIIRKPNCYTLPPPQKKTPPKRRCKCKKR